MNSIVLQYFYTDHTGSRFTIKFMYIQVIYSTVYNHLQPEVLVNEYIQVVEYWSSYTMEAQTSFNPQKLLIGQGLGTKCARKLMVNLYNQKFICQEHPQLSLMYIIQVQSSRSIFYEFRLNSQQLHQYKCYMTPVTIQNDPVKKWLHS